ncbi:M28 family peptidase [Membranihabitans marinus]|uniref:M28 family peptidase n=1 Tax=Membranihabitans marinus TaxID=1227546 RepID=UPI001F3CBA39|nr:M28 family peptidase [Membranihabitans marinus]
MNKLYLLLILLVTVSQSEGQMLQYSPMELTHFTQNISQDSIYKYLSILSSDEFEGRETGQAGNKKAAAFLAKKLNEFGYETPNNTRDYFQYFPLYKQTWQELSMVLGGREFEANKDFYALPSENPNLPSFQDQEIVYLGYGLNNDRIDDFSSMDLSNKMVMIHEGQPDDSNSYSGSGLENTKIKAASEAGVRVILVISEHFASRLARYRPLLLSPSVTTNLPKVGRTNIIYISPGMATAIMARYQSNILAYRKSKYEQRRNNTSPVVISKKVELKMHKLTKYEYVPNVVGFMEGKDPVLRNEILVISAHFDHLGVRGKDIFNGADDDGSGTSSVLEMSRVLSLLAKNNSDFPARSVLFLFANGEEKGLLGSAFYTDHPLYPLDNTIVNLNVDMIGRRDKFHEDDPYYVYIIGSDKLSSDLHKINEEVNTKTTQLFLDYKYNDEADPNRFYYRSDHYNFAKNNVPVIFYFTGVHEDYHRPTDTIEKIEFEKMTTIVELIFGTACELLNNERRPMVDQVKE